MGKLSLREEVCNRARRLDSLAQRSVHCPNGTPQTPGGGNPFSQMAGSDLEFKARPCLGQGKHPAASQVLWRLLG